MRIDKIADELEILQAEKNAGRGVSCVRSVVFDLRRERVEEAIKTARWDWDKIRNYPDIADFLIDHVIGENPDRAIIKS